MFYYYTKFNLVAPVKDNEFIKAREYLLDDNMVEYLDIDRLTNDCINEIRFVLVENDYGYVVVSSISELNDDDLNELSDFISGQASDGLGECFEQNFYSEHDDDYFYCDYNSDEEMCSFDWETNNYELNMICQLSKDEMNKITENCCNIFISDKNSIDF